MALFDFLKRKEEVEKAKEKAEKIKKPAQKAEKVSDAKKVEKKKEVKKEESLDKTQDKKPKAEKARAIKGFSYDIVKEPHISEKATILGEKNQYVFKAYNGSNKQEIKKSIEGIYGVTVLDVNMVKVPQKKRRIGRIEGFRKGYVKAMVTIKEGQKIEIL